jgi:hypothetical protein
MRKGNALFGMYGVSAVDFAAPDRPDLCMAIIQSRKSHGRAYRRVSGRLSGDLRAVGGCQQSGYSPVDGQPAVYLYIAALEVNVLNCRISRVGFSMSNWGGSKVGLEVMPVASVTVSDGTVRKNTRRSTSVRFRRSLIALRGHTKLDVLPGAVASR